MRDLDHYLTLKLYQEQERILWAHKLPLKPATIVLVESNTFWGRWDPHTRSISISRKLITEHTWFSVQSILRHEMAHQYAAECLGESFQANAHTHDAVFRQCCKRLGVPDEFSGATASLQNHKLNWKEHENQDEGIEKLLSKAQKLLALATSSNEHEASLAMEKVRELYARHNLNAALHQEASSRVHLIICHKKKRIDAYQNKVCGILVGFFFVQVIFCKEVDAQSGDEHQAIQLIGTRENVLMAEYVYHFLLNQTEALLRDLKRQRGPLTSMAAKSYRLGVLQGFETRLRQSEAKATSFTHSSKGELGEQPALTSTSVRRDSVSNPLLVLAKASDDLEDYVSTIYPRLHKSSSKRQLIDGDSYLAGTTEGKKLTLKRGVSSRGGSGGLLGHDG